MAILGADGNPVGTEPDKLIGSVTLDDMESFDRDALDALALPLVEALKQGVPMMSPCNVEFVMLARLLVTAQRLMAGTEEASGEE
jgi:hypothetical protein